jgi:hypothetical protein
MDCALRWNIFWSCERLSEFFGPGLRWSEGGHILHVLRSGMQSLLLKSWGHWLEVKMIDSMIEHGNDWNYIGIAILLYNKRCFSSLLHSCNYCVDTRC